MTGNTKAQIPFIDDYKWDELEQAYGSAAKFPEHLMDLMSNDEELVSEAVNGFLHSEACHQYTTYSCTPPTVRCVLYILENHTFEDVNILQGILDFVGACTYSAKRTESLRDEILKGIKCYKRLSEHENEGVVDIAETLLKFCANYAGEKNDLPS
jgi:hypothetical protein